MIFMGKKTWFLIFKLLAKSRSSKVLSPCPIIINLTGGTVESPDIFAPSTTGENFPIVMNVRNDSSSTFFSELCKEIDCNVSIYIDNYVNV